MKEGCKIKNIMFSEVKRFKNGMDDVNISGVLPDEIERFMECLLEKTC